MLTVKDQEQVNQFREYIRHCEIIPCCHCLGRTSIYQRHWTAWENFKRLFKEKKHEEIHYDCDCARTFETDFTDLGLQSAIDLWNVYHYPKVKEAGEIMDRYGLVAGYKIYHATNNYETYKIRSRFSDNKWLNFGGGRRCGCVGIAAYI